MTIEIYVLIVAVLAWSISFGLYLLDQKFKLGQILKFIIHSFIHCTGIIGAIFFILLILKVYLK